MTADERALADARSAHQGRRYADAYQALDQVRDELREDDLELLADAAWWIGRIGDCLSLTEQLHQRYLAEGRVDRAALRALDLGGHSFMRGELTMGMGWLNRARRLLADQPTGEGHALLMYADVSGAIEAGELETAAEGALELQRLGSTLGLPTYVAVGLMCEGLVAIHRGNLTEGFGLLDEAMLPVLADQVKPELAGSIYCGVIAVCNDVADVARARQWTAATEKWLDAITDAVMFHGVCRAHRVRLLATDGEWDRAVAEALQVCRDLADLNLNAVAEAEYELGEVHRVRGELGEAAAAYDRAAALGRDPLPGAALLAAAAGRVGDAWAMLVPAVATASTPFHRARLLRAQVEVGLAAGHLEEATAACERLRAISRTFPSPGFRAWADDAEGATLLAAGRATDARGMLEGAASAYLRVRSPYDKACVELKLARVAAAEGAAADADAHARAAEEIFAKLGVPAPTVASPALPRGLTQRELEVLVLVTGGASNKAVADTLVISEATVRRHLANIFRKLDVGSRTAAAAWAHRHHLA